MSMSTQGPSKSSPSYSSSNPRWKFDVFINYRGADTRNTFCSLLYAALKHRGVLTFYADEVIERGIDIYAQLLKAIEESRIAIVIFSRNYANSTWCLNELSKIIECSREMGMTVLPVFYYVDPFDVRNQTGTFAQAFAEHEELFMDDIEKVERWRDALREVANLSGWLVQDG